MLVLYNDATICAYERPFECGLRYHPELRDIMARSRDWGELEHTWTEYQRKAGREMRDSYKQLIDVMNEIAMVNSKSLSAGLLVSFKKPSTFRCHQWRGILVYAL